MKQSGTRAPASPRGSVYIPDDRSSDQRLPYFRLPTNPFVCRSEALLQRHSGRRKHPLEFSGEIEQGDGEKGRKIPSFSLPVSLFNFPPLNANP